MQLPSLLKMRSSPGFIGNLPISKLASLYGETCSEQFDLHCTHYPIDEHALVARLFGGEHLDGEHAHHLKSASYYIGIINNWHDEYKAADSI